MATITPIIKSAIKIADAETKETLILKGRQRAIFFVLTKIKVKDKIMLEQIKAIRLISNKTLQSLKCKAPCSLNLKTPVEKVWFGKTK